MGLVLDSSICVTAERSGRSPKQMLQSLGVVGVDVSISVITAAELSHGVVRANTEERRLIRESFLLELLRGVPVHPVTVAIAIRAGRLDGFLQASGKRLPLADLLIGATALELDYEIATANVRHFEMIPGLRVRRF